MVWTQAHRYLQLRSVQRELAQSIISEAFLLESLLGADIPDAAYQETAALPAPEHYPSPYHQDLRRLSYKARSDALFCGYRYVITLVNERAGLSVASWIGQALSLHWQTGSMLTPNQVRHGIITEASALGSNGGMATYRIVIEPALYQLRLSAHNRRHHHLSLAALVEEIVSPFGFDIKMSDALKDCHIQHSVQYNQTDLAYLQQHLQRFGITGYYEHSDSAHTLVLVRHDDKALHPDGDDIIDTLSQNPASMADTQDRITMLRPQTSGHVKETHLHRYDNRLRDRYSGSHQSDTKQDSAHQRYLHSHTHMDSDALEQLAQRQQYYYEQRAYQGELQGNIRHLQLPHSYHVAGNPFVTEPISISAICHKIDNHLPVEWLGQSYIDPTTLQPKQRDKAKLAKTEHTHHIIAHYQPHPYHHHIPYGQQLTSLGQAHPSLHGLMSASIIAEGSQGITTDRNHRAHIRYHWQHEDDMSMDDSAQWVPIASHLVADHMGQTHPLRHGQHVLIDFIGGDITHPVIVGSTHNGQGNPDAQHNSITSDSDAIDATSPTWFMNQSHSHPIDGIKTQSIDSSRTGEANKDSSTNGYNQLMFDLYTGSEQISLYSSSHHSSMNLGQLYQQTDHTRGQARGQGISIETQAAGSLQGSTGIYISSDNSKGPMSHQSHSQLQTADQQQQAYATLASTHQPVGLKDSSEPPMEDGETPYAQVSKDSTDTALNDAGAWQQPHILIHAQHDMGIFTGQHSQQTSTQNTHSHATDSTHHHSQSQINHLVAGNVQYYSNKAQTHTAAHGDMVIQAHQNEMRLDSEQTLRIHSRSSIDIIAPDTLTLKAAGSGIEMSGGDVTLITPSQAGYKASKVDWGSGGGIGALQALSFAPMDKKNLQSSFNADTVDSSLRPEKDCPCKEGGAVKTTAGSPVNILQGCKVLFDNNDLDYAGKGYLPFTLKRMYNSQNARSGWFGQGWTMQGYEQKLEVDEKAKKVYLIDNTGRRLAFDCPKSGQSVIQPFLGLTLYRLPNTEKSADRLERPKYKNERFDFLLYQGIHFPKSPDYDQFEGLALRFSHVCKTLKGTTVLLSQLSNRYGHTTQLQYDTSIDNDLSHLPKFIKTSDDCHYELKFERFTNQPRLVQLLQIDQDNDEPLQLVRYDYNERGELIQVYRHNHLMRQFAYTDGLMTWQQMPSGLEATYVYDQTSNVAKSRVVKHTLNNGRSYQFDYDTTINGAGTRYQRTTVTEQPNTDESRTLEYLYDNAYILKQYTSALGLTTTLSHDHLDRVIKVENAVGNVAKYVYEDDKLISKKELVGRDAHTGKAEYSAVHYKYVGNQLVAYKDALGNTQRFVYNDKAQLTETINPLKHATKYSYDDKGNIIEKVLANGSRFKFEFDDSGNLVRQTDCSGYSTEYIYDEQQRIAQVVNAEGQSTRYHYDDSKPWLDSLVRQIDYPDGNTVQMQYNDLGQVTKRSANNAKEGMTFDYDIDGLLSKQTNEAGYSLTYAYDSYRRLYELTNENNEHWYFSYDKGDNLIAETRFDNYQSRYTYDALGHLITQTDNTQQSTAQQRRIVYERDLLGQLRYQSSSSGDQTERTDYTFNKLGQLLTATNEHSQISLTYDANGQLIKEKQSSWLTIDVIEQRYNLELQHHYDEVGNRIKTILPDGKEINQLYYGSGHLYNQSLFDPNADQHIELRHSERNKLHLEVSRQQGVLDSHYHYDTMGRLLEQRSSHDEQIIIQRQYRYEAGQLTQLTGQSMVRQLNDIHPNKDSDGYDPLNTFIRHHQYQYDVLGRLTEHQFNNSYNEQATTEHFAFDPASNRISVQTDDIAEKAFAYRGRPSELIQNNQRIRYVYDTHGRVHHKAITSINASDGASSVDIQLQYNANNELKSSVRVERKDTQITETQTTYYYDAFGRRITKYSEVKSRTQNKEQSAQVSTTQYEYILWDGDLPIQAYSNRQVYTTVYDQGSFVPVARLMWLRDDLSKVASDDIESLDDENEQDGNLIQVYHYHNDQLGTPNELTNEKGEVVWLADYEAWGNTAKLVWNEQLIGQIQVSQNELQPIRFQGQHFDEETGLHYNRFRYYDPDMGMFTSRDPIELMGGNNVFQYAPNPTGWVDPLGLVSREEAIASLKLDPKVKPFLPAKPRQGHMPGRPEVYSNKQINKRWSDMYQKDIARHIRAGRMPSCPPSAPNICTNCEMGSGGWKKYGGDTSVYHCGFDGYLENRIPNKNNPAPANECFYDESGRLVDENHKWKGCRGTPDYFPFYGTFYPSDVARGGNHMSYKEPGGPKGPSVTHANIGEEAAAASIEYYKKHPDRK